MEQYLLCYKNLLRTGDLTLTEWILLCKIIEKENQYISNKELSRCIKTQKETVGNLIHNLKVKGYITSEYREKNYVKRRFFVLTEKTNKLIKDDRKELNVYGKFFKSS